MDRRDNLRRLAKFRVDEHQRRVTQIETMIEELRREASELDQQTMQEQERVGIHDVNHFAYPIFAKSALTRRDKLIASAKELDLQLEAARAELMDVVEELKKLDILAERDEQAEKERDQKSEQLEQDEISAYSQMKAS